MQCGNAGAPQRPNFIVMVADDLGYGDVGIFGNATIPTPNIDRMGRQGAKFSHSLAAASLCTPSRAAILTGRYPVRYGMASPTTNRVLLFVAQSGGLPQSETTFSKILQNSGYRTGLIGKWHLGNDRSRRGDGEHHPNRHGFDYFYGMPLTNLKDFGQTGESVVKSFYPRFHAFLVGLFVSGATTAFTMHHLGAGRCVVLVMLILSVFVPVTMLSFQLSIPTINSILMRNGQVVEQPVRIEGSTSRFVRESKKFMQSAMQSGTPFLLMLSFLKVHTVHKPSPRFLGKSVHGPFGDCVMELDWGVGEILNFVSGNTEMSNTLIFFTSDNGGHLEDVSAAGQVLGGSNGAFRGGKGHGAMEGGIRVPTLAYWPGVIVAGQEVRTPVSLMDLYPTIVETAGLPVSAGVDGRSLVPFFRQPMSVSHHKFLFHYCGTYLHGATYTEDLEHVWKVHFFTPKYKNEQEDKCHYVCTCHGSGAVQHSPPALFNLASDPSQRRDLAESHPHVLQEVSAAVRGHMQSLHSKTESQFSFWNSMWRPDLQPCCNFPLCSCREEENDAPSGSEFF